MVSGNEATTGVPSENSPLLLPDGNNKSSNAAIEVETGRDPPHKLQKDDSIPIADEPTTGRLLVVMGSIWLGCFLAALDSTVIATLSAPISASFHSLSLLPWLASAYFIANAALQPISGRLTDILGRRAGLVFSNIFFAAGNLICGYARDEKTMILGRVISGIGGGGLTAISTFVGSDLVPLRKRGLWQGVGNVFYGIGAGLGGVLGGWINDVWGWRVAFLVQVPPTIISGILVFFTLRIPIKYTGKPAWRRIDYLGTFSILFYGPIYFQVKGLSTTAAGVRLIPSSIGFAFGSVGCGVIMRWTGRYYFLSVCTQIMFLASLVLYVSFELDTPSWEAFLAFFLSGIGYSGMLTITVLALIAAVSHANQAVITSASYAFRSTGSTIGIAISSAVFQNILSLKLHTRFSGLPHEHRYVEKLKDSLDEIGKLPPGLREAAMDCYMGALRGVFITILGIGVLGAAVSLAMKEHTLHSNLARK
ncbi:MAG: hypothetical protein Q9221_004914 [Calogaya cf. arnoldii]